jgi:Domain of unknown function (DUF5916)/Carbohydrate family 9 binding domain-like
VARFRPSCAPRIALIVTLALAPTLARAQTPAPANATRPIVHAYRVDHPPTIDGNLDDEAWKHPPVETTEWASYNPLYGDKIPQKTTVWVAYDDNYFYFAFKCDDPEPRAIKTSVSRRDNIGGDDWVGLSLDSLGTGQLSYHMMVNPSGVQMDLLNSIAADEDIAPDWIWDSAGRLTETGYAVEIRLPLQSIRFRGGRDVRMGILFWRRVSRLGVSVAWPALEPGKWVFEKHASLIVPELQPRPPREVIPSTTFSSNQQRASPDSWASADNKAQIGVSTKIGLTPTVTLDATVNPDFSQVESDAFQVQVNQRFPVFFSEKRPFFMEGAGIFTLAGTLNGDQSFFSAVNTRNIIDPIFGAKITGSAGKLNFATLTAVDKAPGETAEPTDFGFNRNRVFNVLRGEYAFTPASYAGAIVTDTEFAGTFNRVVGGDLSWKVSPNQRVTGFALESVSRAQTDPQSKAGFGTQLRYSYNTKAWTVSSHFEHYDVNFRMDTAFINRVGDTNGWFYLERDFYPDKTKISWLRKIQPFSFTQATHDVIQRGNELFTLAGLRLFFTRQGFFRIDYIAGHEPFAGQEFKNNRLRVQSNAQIFRWLSFYANANAGYATFYDPTTPYQGKSSDVSTGFNYQPNGQLSQSVDFERVAFKRASTGERVYTVHILNSKTTYQFTRRFFLRAIAQYDSSKYRVLTDFLASYEVHPGTVFYAGYGSLIEQRDYRDNLWIEGAGRYQTVQRGLFLKASYLHRF